MVVVTSPIGDQAPPAFAAIIISPENHNLVSRFLITFCKIVINTMVAVRLSIIADKTKAKMEKITNSPFLDLVFIKPFNQPLDKCDFTRALYNKEVWWQKKVCGMTA